MSTVLITGANSGIGFAASQQLAQRGARVLMACRSAERGQAALDRIRSAQPDADLGLVQLDMSSPASIRAAVSGLQGAGEGVDALVHNAAIFDLNQSGPVMTAEGLERFWATNLVGPVLLTRLLMPALLARKARVICASSKGLLAMPFLKLDPQAVAAGQGFTPTKAYYQSKLALLIWAQHLAQTQPELAVNSVWIPSVRLDPGREPEMGALQAWVYRMKAKQALDPQEMAPTYVSLALDAEWSERTGTLVDHHLASVSLPRRAQDPTTREDTLAWIQAHVG